MQKSYIYILLLVMILYIGCAPHFSKKDTLVLPDSNTSHLKAHGRFVVNANYVRGRGVYPKTSALIFHVDRFCLKALS